MTKLEQEIKKQRVLHGVSGLREMFAKRLDDELFESVGAMASGVVKQKKMTGTELVWLGFEHLCESPYLKK